MKITQHGDHLYQLTRLIAFNSFIVREDDGLTVVDTGVGNTAEAIVQAAKTLGAPIRRIALTHSHADHVGALDALHALVPDAEVVISTREARFLAGERTLDADEPQTPLKGSHTTCTTKPTRLVNTGDRIGSLEVIASPGHTPGHISFLDQRDRTLIAGDAFTTQAGISTAGTFRLLFPFMTMATWHRPTALRSAEALLALNPSRLAVGHGAVLENPAQGMKAAIDEAKRLIEGRNNGRQTAY